MSVTDMFKALPALVELATNPAHSIDFISLSNKKIYCKLKNGESVELSHHDVKP